MVEWLYCSSMKKLLVALLLCTNAFDAVHAQGLIGAPNCPRSASQAAPFIEGKSDSERWSNFQTIQPSLIGMTYEQVVKALGKGKAFIKSDEFTLKPHTQRDRSCLLYQIAKTKIPSKSAKTASIELTVVFKENFVESYEVESVCYPAM